MFLNLPITEMLRENQEFTGLGYTETSKAQVLVFMVLTGYMEKA